MHELEILDCPRDRGARAESLDCSNSTYGSLLKGLHHRLAGPILLLLVLAFLVSCSHWKPRDFEAGLSIHRSDESESENHENLGESAPSIRRKGIMQLANTTDGQGVECPRPEQRHVYYVNQLFWAWAHTLAVSAVTMGDDGEQTVENLGYVKSEPFSFSGFQEWTDVNGTVIASSHQDAITTVTNIYVDDCAHHFLATISEQISPANSAISLYTVQNADGDIIAISTMSKNFGTEVDINDQASGKRLVTISKGWGQVSDSWSATFRQGMVPSLANDPRVMVMLLASASASGSWGLGGFFAVLLNPLWLLFLCCCCCACATAFARARETVDYTEIPGGSFYGQGFGGGFGGPGGFFTGTQYV